MKYDEIGAYLECTHHTLSHIRDRKLADFEDDLRALCPDGLNAFASISNSLSMFHQAQVQVLLCSFQRLVLQVLQNTSKKEAMLKIVDMMAAFAGEVSPDSVDHGLQSEKNEHSVAG